MLLELSEIWDIVIITLAIGFIFKDFFHYRPKVEVITPEYYLKKHRKKMFNWNNFWFAAAIVAPSIILHEFGHKFVAIAYGLTASFHAAYTWLGIGIALKLIGLNFIFFVPAFTSISGAATTLQSTLIAFAGPGVNLVLWLVALVLLKTVKMKDNIYHAVFLVSRINMLLFIFNMLPLPFFDGSTVFKGLLTLL
jgi:Zn-dependent protease